MRLRTTARIWKYELKNLKQLSHYVKILLNLKTVFLKIPNLFIYNIFKS